MPAPASWPLYAMLAALTLAPAAVAAPIGNEAALWANPETRYVIVGETHGTAETPAFFGDLACDAHKSGRPVVVAVEIGEMSQGAIDRWLASDGGPKARAQFLVEPSWKSNDGRSSRAYLALFERLRTCLKARQVTAVAAIQPAGPWSSQSDYNTAMAQRLTAAAARQGNALVVALVGSFHVGKRPQVFAGETIVPAAGDLPTRETVSLEVSTAGEAWNCQRAGCGVHPVAGDAPKRRSVSLGPGAPAGFDGTIDLGVPATASPPAVPAQPSNAAG